MAQYKRNFPCWLTAYFDYSYDDFCPEEFHRWTGLSVLAAAVERKVWIRQHLEHASIMHYPNIYVLLVSHPGVGKSTAMDRGVDLLEEMKEAVDPDFKIIPNQVTEAALLDLMKISKEVQLGNSFLQHSSGYFYASEASASALQNLYGDFNATITSLYDCPKWFRKKLKGEKDATEIQNVCFNLLAGSTFNYLKRLVNEDSVEGGLASRFIYVISKDRKIRTSQWRTEANSQSKESLDFRKALLDDLSHIHSLKGWMTPTPGFIKCWEEAQPEFDRYLIGLDSNRLESLNARRFTNLMKVCMLVSLSESDDLQLKEEHWHQARALVENVSRENAFVVTSALVADKNSQGGLTQKILTSIGKAAGDRLEKPELTKELLRHGSDLSKVNDTIKSLKEAGQISEKTESGKVWLELLVNPEANL